MVTKKNKSSARRNNEEEEEKKTEFTSIIHPTTAKDYETKLMLPPAFVSKFGSTLSDFATLRVANGGSLQVGLTTLGRDIWFDNGWTEFVGRYAIHEGCLLLFQYTGRSRFRVVIFDETATEIEYPSYGDQRAGIVPSDDQHDLVTDEEDCIPEKKKTRRKCKSGKFSLGSPANPSGNACCSPEENEVTYVHGELSDGFGSASLRESKATREARNYQPDNPYFQVPVRACDIESGSVLHVPAEFSDKYLDTASEYMKILAPGGRRWLVELIWKLEGGVKFRNGWHQFASGNDLKEGDVCVIEFLEAEMEFKASIFRAA